MTQKDVFDFPVEQLPTIVNIGGEEIRTERDAIVRTDTNTILGYVSSDAIYRTTRKGKVIEIPRNYYKLIKHTELVQGARDAIKALGFAPTESTTLMGGGARLIHEFRFDDVVIEPIPGDFINMKLEVINSYDTTKGIGFNLGGERRGCTNGLIAFQKAFFTMNKHTGGFDMDITMSNLKKAIEMFYGHVSGFYKLMGNTPLSVSAGIAIIKEFMETGLQGTKLPEKYGFAVEAVWENPLVANEIVPEQDVNGIVEGAFKTVTSNPSLDEARTVWAFYNAFTLIFTHYVASVERRVLLHQALQNKITSLVR